MDSKDKEIPPYNPEAIEKKWQKKWADANIFRVVIDPKKEKFYCLEMYPYPSASLHMGHLRNYSIGDCFARYKRMRGYNVLYPMGYDSFGLPAENAAINHGIDPERWTNTNIATISNISGSKGLATSVDTGSTTITATSGSISGSTTLTVTQAVLESIEISPASADLFLGTTLPFTATGRFSDSSTQDLTTSVTWNSSDTTIATISNTPGFQGIATASFFNTGSTTISATFLNIISSAATLTVHF